MTAGGTTDEGAGPPPPSAGALRVLALAEGPADAAVVRAALAIGETTVLLVGPPEGDAFLQQALAAGAARAVRVWDEVLESVDFLGVAWALASAATTALGELAARPTILVAGDRGRGAVGPAIAERLGLPHLTRVTALSLDEGRVIVRRHMRDHVRLFVAAPPCLVCVLGDRAPLAAADAGAGAPEAWTLAQVGLSAADVSFRRQFRLQPGHGPVGAPRRFADLAALVERLRADRLLPRGSTAPTRDA